MEFDIFWTLKNDEEEPSLGFWSRDNCELGCFDPYNGDIPMKIWITGMAGFLGSHLRDALIERGHDVFGNDNMLCGSIMNIVHAVGGRQQAHVALGDCRNIGRMKKLLSDFRPDVLVHCAATAHEGLSSFSPSFVTKNIYEASVATFSAAISSGVQRIVFMSSMARYGKGSLPFRERQLTDPVDPYGIAKVAAEETLKVLCETHDVKWAIAVPHNIIGPRQRSVDPYRNVAAIMINRCKLGKPPIIYGDGQQKRCFSPIKDCLHSLVQMVEGGVDGEIINIGPDKGSITVNGLAQKIIKLTGFKGEPIYVPDRPNEVKEAYCSSEKARKLLGYEEQQSIDDCLQEMVDYINPNEFIYDFPLEIVTDRIPKTWSEKLL